MKRFYFLVILAVSLNAQQAFSQKSERIPFLQINMGKTYVIKKGDSSISLIIDTLVMEDKAQILLIGKKNCTLTVKFAVVGAKCRIGGNDSRNNGTNIDLRINFQELGSLSIDVPGQNFKDGNRRDPIGRGGNVTVHYLNTGLTPQNDRPKQSRFLTVNNGGGQGSSSPYADLATIHSQIRSSASTQGRPLTGLSSGTVYQGEDGSEGKSNFVEVSSL